VSTLAGADQRIEVVMREMEAFGVDAHHDARLERQRVVGTLGVVVAIAIAVILGVHPWGTTELYDDGARFVDHVGAFWVVIHVLGAFLLLAIPVVVGAWGETIGAPAGQVFGKLAATVAVGAAALGVLHLAGTDTMTFLAYEDTLARGVEGAVAGADVLLRIHAATLTAFMMTMFVALPTAGAMAAAFDRDWSWRFWLPGVTALLGAASVTVTLFEKQWTTLSEMGLLRPSITLFLVWFGLISYGLRRAATAVGGISPAAARSSA
jgi:hypothetical protein